MINNNEKLVIWVVVGVQKRQGELDIFSEINNRVLGLVIIRHWRVREYLLSHMEKSDDIKVSNFGNRRSNDKMYCRHTFLYFMGNAFLSKT